MNYNERIDLDGEMWCTVKYAASMVGVQPISIYKTIERSGLRSQKALGVIVVPEQDVLAHWAD